jgi:hypothetical protein
MGASRPAFDDGSSPVARSRCHRRTTIVTTPSTPVAAAFGTTASMPRGFVSRVVAAVAHGSVGLLLVASVVGMAIAQGIISRGVVMADASDVATLQAFAPLAVIFGVVGVAHVVAGLGMLLGSRTAAALGIGLGVLDVIAGIVILAFNAGAHDTSVDGTSFAMTFVVVGIVLAVTARAADWNTHGPVEA